jgi:hypothetical protein
MKMLSLKNAIAIFLLAGNLAYPAWAGGRQRSRAVAVTA